MSDELFDLKKAADYCTVSKRTLYREHERGMITFVKVRGSTRVWRSELDRYLRASERVVAA